MSVLTCVTRFVITNLLTVLYSFMVLPLMLLSYLRNPFKDPWAQKLRLDPPACLSDPKYGVHKCMIFNGVKLHYVESGDPSKPLMIFVHGFPEFWYSWRYQITDFKKDYWCVAIDLRGYGDSEKIESVTAYKKEIIVEDIRDIVRKLGREKCILVAHDWGSVIAIKYRDTYPETLLALIALGATSSESLNVEIWSNLAQFTASWYTFFFRCPWLPEKLMQMNDLEALDKAFLVEGKDTITKQDVECYKYWFRKNLALTLALNYYRANPTYIVSNKKKDELPIPFLHINGANDAFLGQNILDRMKDFYAHIETESLQNCGHMIQQEEPVKVNARIRQFLNKHKIL